MSTTYDAIVVGARCGGAPTAMLLARRGYRVLLLDKTTFPSDTLSTHMIHPTGIAALARWGLLDEVAKSGAPEIANYALDFGPFRVSGAPRPTPDGIGVAFAPRRTVLDQVLVTAAADAGVEVRQNAMVEGVLGDSSAVNGVYGRDGSGRQFREQAQVVIGADGRRSHVARWVGAQSYATQPTLAATYYAYWSGLPADGLEVFIRPARSFGVFPTNDDLTLVVMSWPRSEFTANRVDVEGNYLRSLALVPEVAAKVSRGRRESRFFGTGDAPGFYRRASGPGWALVGDARHHKDPCTAKGISEAFLDAEALAAALDDIWSRGESRDARMDEYQRLRQEQTMPMYDFTCQLARLEPPPPEMAALLAAVSGCTEASRDFVSVLAGTKELGEFMHPDNVGRIMAHAA